MKTNEQPSEIPLKRDAMTTSLWQDTYKKPRIYDQPSLSTDTVFDVLIAGGGITGLTTALLLQEAGFSCMICEARSVGFGTTGGTTAHLNTMLDTPYNMVEDKFGTENAVLVANASDEAIQLVDSFIRKYSIACDFEYKDGYLFAQTEKEEKELQEIYDASRRAGVDIAFSSHIPVPVDFRKVVVYHKQAQFHPLKYLSGLVSAFKEQGGILLENTRVTATELKEGIHLVTCGELSFKAKLVVYATHIPPGINILHLRCAPYRSYAMAFKLKGSYPSDLAYDMKDPYHYYRSHVIDGERYLIAGGEDHKTGHGDPELAFENLEKYVREHFDVDTVGFNWSSQYFEPSDGLPYIGKMPSAEAGIYVATGFSGNGMIFGTISGKILSDMIAGKENPYVQLFSPSRIKPFAGFTEFVKENADVAYHFITDRFSVDEIESLTELAPDSGSVIEYKDQKLAIYKDASGRIYALNPVCTHAGCMVNWNQAEKSWDCPCHGGRYDIEGNVLTGPPRIDLQRVELGKLDDH